VSYANSDFAVERFAAEKGDWFKEMVTFMHDLNAGLLAAGELVTGFDADHDGIGCESG